MKIPQIPKVLSRHLGIWGIFAKVSAFLIFAVKGIGLPIINAEFWLDYAGRFPCRHDCAFCLRSVCRRIVCSIAAYSKMLPQSTAVAFILEEVPANGSVMGCHSMMVWWQDKSRMWYRSSWVSCVSVMVIFLVGRPYVAASKLFRYGKFALQIRICWPLFIII